MNFSVTQNGKPLSKSLYTWDSETKTFSTKENNLVLDFLDMDYVTFKTGPDCTFDTGSGCTFDTGYHCTFKTGYHCTFKTGFGCTFDTDSSCTFDTGTNSTFKTGSNSVLVRRDIFEVHILPDNITVKIKHGNPGLILEESKHKITIDDNEIELSNESYEAIKKIFK